MQAMLDYKPDCGLPWQPDSEPWIEFEATPLSSTSSRLGTSPWLPSAPGGIAEIFTAGAFVAKLNQLSEQNQVDDAIDLVIKHFEHWLENRAWDTCKQVLRDIEVGRIHPAISLSVLSMTLVEKARLGTLRRDYYRRTESQLVVAYGQRGAADNLRGLE